MAQKWLQAKSLQKQDSSAKTKLTRLFSRVKGVKRSRNLTDLELSTIKEVAETTSSEGGPVETLEDSSPISLRRCTSCPADKLSAHTSGASAKGDTRLPPQLMERTRSVGETQPSLQRRSSAQKQLAKQSAAPGSSLANPVEVITHVAKPPSASASGRSHLPAAHDTVGSQQTSSETVSRDTQSNHRSPAGPAVSNKGDGSVEHQGKPSRSSSEYRPHRSVQSGNTANMCPPHGAKAICGRRARMEDAFSTIPFLCEVQLPDCLAEQELVPPRLAPNLKKASPTNSHQDTGSQWTASEKKNSSRSEQPAYMETLHFFGVYDGHGGAEAALHCAKTLHQRVAEALTSVCSSPSFNNAAAAPSDSYASTAAHAEPEVSTAATSPGSSQPVALASTQSADDDQRSSSSEDSSGSETAYMDCESLLTEDQSGSGKLEVLVCNYDSFETAFTSAFTKADEEFGKADNAALVGTTAVVALVGSRQMFVANCGDSRAVLCRGGQGMPLTDDHKAAREDETARVEAAGGQILYWNGVRVMGVLAVSRAIGDHCLRPYVIAEPEVTIISRRHDDELLLLASDGLWDVLSNQEACTLAKRCLRRARQRGASRENAAKIAATVLTRAAVDRGSRDNVTVVVVDLSIGAAGPEESSGEGTAQDDSETEDDFMKPQRAARTRSTPVARTNSTKARPDRDLRADIPSSYRS